MTTDNTDREELEPCDVCTNPDTVLCFCVCHNVMHCFDCASKARSRAAVAAPRDLLLEEFMVQHTSGAREAAEELAREGWLLADITQDERDQVAAIISKHFPSAVPVEEQSYEFAFDQRCYYCRNKCCHDAKAHIAAISEHG